MKFTLFGCIIAVIFPKASAKLQKNCETCKHLPIFSAIFYIMLFLFCKITGYKKAGIVSRQCLTFSVSGAENDLEYHLAAPRMLTNKNQIQLLS